MLLAAEATIDPGDCEPIPPMLQIVTKALIVAHQHYRGWRMRDIIVVGIVVGAAAWFDGGGHEAVPLACR